MGKNLLMKKIKNLTEKTVWHMWNNMCKKAEYIVIPYIKSMINSSRSIVDWKIKWKDLNSLKSNKLKKNLKVQAKQISHLIKCFSHLLAKDCKKWQHSIGHRSYFVWYSYAIDYQIEEKKDLAKLAFQSTYSPFICAKWIF